MAELFVTTTPFLQPLLTEELEEMGVPKIRQGYSGVFVPLEMRWVYEINYRSRFATRVLWPLAHFPCAHREDLYRHAFKIRWPEIFSLEQSFAIDANVSSQAFRHSLYAAQLVKDAICDRFRKECGDRPAVKVDNPDIQLNLFIQEERGILSFDTSGAPLFKRGWRTQAGAAPLQESLAAGIVKLAGILPDDLVCDPFCGSGTLLIEAAFARTNTPAGFYRTAWGFFHHPDFSETDWEEIKSAANQQILPLDKGRIFGADKDPKAIEMCLNNLKNAGFDQQIEVQCKDIRSYFPKEPPTLILANPPYGKRMKTSEELFLALTHFIKTRCAKTCRANFLCPDPSLIQGLFACGAQPSLSPLRVGGIDLWLCHL